MNNIDHHDSHGQSVGNCTKRAEVEIRAGISISFRRIVPILVLRRSLPAITPTSREPMNAIVASTSQAAFAVKIPDGR